MHLALSIARKDNNKEGKGSEGKEEKERKASKGQEMGAVMGLWQEPPCGRGHPIGAMASSNTSLCFHKEEEKRE